MAYRLDSRGTQPLVRQRVGIGLIGTGWAAGMHAQALANLKIGAEYVVGRSADRVEAFASRFGIPKCLLDVSQLPCPGACPLVIVCLPPGPASAVASGLVSRGYYVLLEKPGAMNFRDLALDFGTKAPEDLRRLAFSYHLPHDFKFRLARKVVESGKLGKPVRAYLRMFMPMISWSPGRKSWALGAAAPSIWIEAGVHLIHLATWFFGAPRILGVANVRSDRQCVAGTALLGHKNEMVSFLDLSYLSGLRTPRGGIEIQFTKGNLVIDRGSYTNLASSLMVESVDGRLYTRGPTIENGIETQMERILRSIQNRGTVLASGVTDLPCAAATLAVAEALSDA